LIYSAIKEIFKIRGKQSKARDKKEEDSTTNANLSVNMVHMEV